MVKELYMSDQDYENLKEYIEANKGKGDSVEMEIEMDISGNFHMENVWDWISLYLDKEDVEE